MLADRIDRTVGVRIDTKAAAWWMATAVLLVAVGVSLYHVTRDTTLWFDDWNWVLYRRGGSLQTLLRPYNQHFSLVPIAIYKVLMASRGIADWSPYRGAVIVAHLLCVASVFAYARSRVGGLVAVIAAALIALFGPGWQNFLWSFQIGWLLSVASGIGALLALDRADRPGDVAASLLLMVSLASSGVGMAIALGVVVEVALSRRARWWVAAGPVAVFALWWILYQHAPVSGHAIVLTPQFAAQGLAASLAALAGLGGGFTLSGPGMLLTWGTPLLVAGIALAAWRLHRLGSVSARVLALIAMLLGFWVITGIGRAGANIPAYSSRYLYVGAVLAVLLAVELARGIAVGRVAGTALALAAIIALVSNVDVLRTAAGFLRAEGRVTTGDLGALHIGRGLVGPRYVAQQLPGYPLVALRAGPYFAAAASLGTPADSPSQIANAPENARVAADRELLSIHRVAVDPGPRANGSTACATRTAPAVSAPGQQPAQLALPLPSTGVLIRAAGGSATVAVRRFASQYQPIGTIAPGTAGVLRIGPDLASRSWQLQVSTSGRVSVCGLSS